jgi:hypothetical protein
VSSKSDSGTIAGYQRLFRALGDWLDERGPANFSVIEVPAGFTAITSSRSPNDRNSVALAHDKLLQYEAGLRRRRLDPEQKVASVPQAGWAVSTASRQDCLRAIGFELDDADARTVVLDQLDDGFHLSYSYFDPTQGYLWRKRTVSLGSEEIGQIVKLAHGRRTEPADSGFLQRLRRPPTKS